MPGKPVCFRTEIPTRRSIDAAAAKRGMPRADWLAWVVDRALAGAGYLDPEEVTARREERARTAAYRVAMSKDPVAARALLQTTTVDPADLLPEEP